ncbi:DUF4249 domain-containing protein [Pontibacter pamirensis]|uniref:DUF4249 domain-containing protein n=1 Tax=Pontibacter pamirensis TaxID=2562824 RepID=UPI00138A1F7F|nr:DUF4249 domain-containing protein [Pontibacter pamirensis]
MKKYILISLSLLSFAFSSCEEVIDYELDTAETKLVVEGLITNQPGPYSVRLSNTKGYLDEGRTPGVNGALVIVSDNQGTVDTLQQVSDGIYQTTKLQGQPGNTYYLKAVVNGREYTAQSYMPTVSPIESLKFEYKTSPNEENEGFHPILRFSDPAGKGNNYRFNVTVNGVVKPDELAVINDELYDGETGDVDMQFGLEEGDRLKIELFSLDKPAYKFWIALVNQQNEGGGPFDVTPGNAPSNISNGAIGFFGASAVSAIEAEAK